MKKLNKSLIAGISLFVAFVVFTILVKVVDVAAVGPLGSKIGFSKINKSIFDGIGTNDLFYNISEFFGTLALVLAGVFVIVGIVQLIKRKSLKMVDEERCAQCYGTPFSFPLPSFAIQIIMIFRKCSIKLGFYLT